MTRQPFNQATNSLPKALLLGLAAMVIAAVCPAADNQVPCVTDLYAFQKDGAASGRTEVMIINGADRYRSVLLHAATALRELGFDQSWDLLLGDYNGDAVPDLYAIEKQFTPSGQTELHVLDGASFFGAHLLYTKTPLSEVGSDFKWVLSTAGCTGAGIPDQGPY